MNYSICYLLIALLFLAGCVSPRETTVPDDQLEITRMTPLPPLESMPFGGLRLNLLVHVLKDGTVDTARLLGSSGDTGWDALAMQAIKKWQFSIPRLDGVPTDRWARQVLVVQVEEPIIMTLGRLEVNNQRAADSLYLLLGNGIILDSSFKQSLEKVDIMTYPKRVRTALKNLRENDFTQPIRLGETYIIFKRFPHVENNNLPG